MSLTLYESSELYNESIQIEREFTLENRWNLLESSSGPFINKRRNSGVFVAL